MPLMSDNEGLYFVIPTDDVCERIEPYVHVLYPYGIDNRRIIEYALRTHHSGDYSHCRKVIEDDLGCDLLGLQPAALVETAMDAVGDALGLLQRNIHASLGCVPDHLIVYAFVGDSPIISPIKADE